MTKFSFLLRHGTDNSRMRKDDSANANFFRSGNRVFSQNGEWFYQTREGDQGPFATREAAAVDLDRYVNQKVNFDAIPYEATPKTTTSGSDVETGGFTLVDQDDG